MTSPSPATAFEGHAARPLAPRLAGLAPGVGLCVLVTLAALGFQSLGAAVFGRAWLEALVLAILVGTAVRTAWTPGARWIPGINFCAKIVLEVAVMLMGASISASAIVAIGPGLLAAIAGVVVLAITVSYGAGRLLGLPRKMAVLIACGNSICGNAAIAAVAPVIGADADDAAAAIAFTAVLGVVVVLGLPLSLGLLRLSPTSFGVFAGLTVYAAPQVVAATAPIGPLAVQMGTLVKLARVLMLGPVCLGLALLQGRSERAAPALKIHHLVPWFIVGFLALAAARSANLVPMAWVAPSREASGWLTIVSMAALGLGVDLRTVAGAGPRVTSAVVASLAALGVIAFALVRLLKLG